MQVDLDDRIPPHLYVAVAEVARLALARSKSSN
jgi:type III secretion system FlhB-like substrate exporter